jgi:hypothetical protein
VKITGAMLIGNSEVFGTRENIRAFNPVPAALLPDSLQDANPLNIWRLHDGKLTQS